MSQVIKAGRFKFKQNKMDAMDEKIYLETGYEYINACQLSEWMNG